MLCDERKHFYGWWNGWWDQIILWLTQFPNGVGTIMIKKILSLNHQTTNTWRLFLTASLYVKDWPAWPTFHKLIHLSNTNCAAISLAIPNLKVYQTPTSEGKILLREVEQKKSSIDFEYRMEWHQNTNMFPATIMDSFVSKTCFR